MKKIIALSALTLVLSGCAIQEPNVAYRVPEGGVEPVYVYPLEPMVGESIVIDGRPYYRHYHNGHSYYHHHR